MTTFDITTVNLMMATINPQALSDWMAHSAIRDRDHALHRILIETMGPLAPRPHRVFFPNNPDKAATLYGYTQANADALRAMAQACANPLQTEVLPPDSIMTKPMPTNWRQGETFGFDIRVRPIRRFKRNTPPRPKPGGPYPRRTSREIDISLHINQERRAHNLPRLPTGTLYVNWLQTLFADQGGAALITDATSIHSLNQTPTNHKKPSPILGPDLVIQGALTVTDPSAFQRLIASGIGRHKTYGYGMLIIRAMHP